MYPKKNITGEIESCLDPVHMGYYFTGVLMEIYFMNEVQCMSYYNDSKKII